jgi:lysophospholipase L1-like esterase|tara:strand:- start:15 stop:539 length:525 start_codon:yes stop_codon:yes gene_type:complete
MRRKPNLFVKKPTLVVVFLGANDAAVNHKREYAVSLDEYEKNMRAILSMYKNVPRIVVTPPPIIEKDRVQHARETTAFNTPDRLYQHTEKYAAVAEKVGREMGVGVADAFDRFEKLGGGDLSEYFTDGLHFSERGEEVLFELVMETIKHTYPWVSWERLNLDAPLHGELAEKNT